MSKDSLKNEDICYVFTELVVNLFADFIDEVNNGTVNVIDFSHELK